MKTGISRSLLDRLLEEAAACPDQEICGLLFGDGRRIEAARRAANVSGRPADRFELDPQALFDAIRTERGGGARIVGWYHSHPAGAPEPSTQDAHDAAPDGRLWLIIGGGRALLWRAVAGGARHGRFDPVGLDVLMP